MHLRLFDTDFTALDVVEEIDSLLWIERYSKHGDFELYTPVTSKLLSLLREDRYLQLEDGDDTMIIESAGIKTDVELGNRFVVQGRALTSILDRRVVFQRTIFDETPLQDAIETLLIQNGINSPGQPARDIPGLIFTASTDPAVLAPILTAEYYGENLYDTIAFLCGKTGLGFRIKLNASNEFEFSLYSGKDRSYEQIENPYVVFSPTFDNLKSSSYFYSKRHKKTIALITGDAYNMNPRPTIDFDPWENDPSDPNYGTIRTGLERRELYVDAPDLNLIDPNTGLPFTNPTGTWIMYERARQELNKNIAFETFDGEVDTTDGFKYRMDYGLGDIVQIENEYGLKGRKKITEVVISENLGGYGIYPTFELV